MAMFSLSPRPISTAEMLTPDGEMLSPWLHGPAYERGRLVGFVALRLDIIQAYIKQAHVQVEHVPMPARWPVGPLREPTDRQADQGSDREHHELELPALAVRPVLSSRSASPALDLPYSRRSECISTLVRSARDAPSVHFHCDRRGVAEVQRQRRRRG
eukprot:3379540-Prymnesium_polylepis.2